jgi:hypothetical protein
LEGKTFVGAGLGVAAGLAVLFFLSGANAGVPALSNNLAPSNAGSTNHQQVTATGGTGTNVSEGATVTGTVPSGEPKTVMTFAGSSLAANPLSSEIIMLVVLGLASLGVSLFARRMTENKSYGSDH